jgi:CBS domain-containing protein
MIVESLMKTELITAAVDESVAHSAWSMARNGVGAVLVVEADELVGILSERDVLVKIVAEGREPTTTKVVEIATSDVVSVDVNASVRECAELIQAKGVRHLPVLRDGKPVGILSRRDFFTYVVEVPGAWAELIEGRLERATKRLVESRSGLQERSPAR